MSGIARAKKEQPRKPQRGMSESKRSDGKESCVEGSKERRDWRDEIRVEEDGKNRLLEQS